MCRSGRKSTSEQQEQQIERDKVWENYESARKIESAEGWASICVAPTEKTTYEQQGQAIETKAARNTVGERMCGSDRKKSTHEHQE